MNESQSDIGDRDNPKADHILKQPWHGCIQPDPVFNHQGGAELSQKCRVYIWFMFLQHTSAARIVLQPKFKYASSRLIPLFNHAIWPCFPPDFRCCECSCILSHWYYEREGQLFCKKHYWARFGEHCHGCKETITTGLIMVTISDHAVQMLLNKTICLRSHKILAR